MSSEDRVNTQDSDEILCGVITLNKERKLALRIIQSDSWEMKQFIQQRNMLRLRKVALH